MSGMRVRKSTLFMALLALSAALMLASPALAQGETPPAGPTPSDDAVNQIAKNMYCPVCENIPLDVCGTAACKEWREEIKDKLTLGWTEDEIYAYFELKYGDRVLAAPPAEGFNWGLYVIPPLVLAFAVYVLVRVLRDQTKGSAKTAGSAKPVPDDVDDALLSRLDDELKQRDA